MRNFFVILIGYAFFGSSVFAAEGSYHCKIEVPPGSTVGEFSINPAEEENKFIELDDGVSAGCVIFRSTPAYLSCVVGKSEETSGSAVVDLGSKLIALKTVIDQETYSLTCVLENSN